MKQEKQQTFSSDKKALRRKQIARMEEFDRWYERYIIPEEKKLDSSALDSQEIIKRWYEFQESKKRKVRSNP